jgi:hypothetical protein
LIAAPMAASVSGFTRFRSIAMPEGSSKLRDVRKSKALPQILL